MLLQSFVSKWILVSLIIISIYSIHINIVIILIYVLNDLSGAVAAKDNELPQKLTDREGMKVYLCV